MTGIPEYDVPCIGIEHLGLIARKSRQGCIQFPGKNELPKLQVTPALIMRRPPVRISTLHLDF